MPWCGTGFAESLLQQQNSFVRGYVKVENKKNKMAGPKDIEMSIRKTCAASGQIVPNFEGAVARYIVDP